MSVNIQEWQQSYSAFENQVKVFNDKVNTTDLTKEDISKIYQTVKAEVKRLSAFAEAVKTREEELEKGSCCSPSRKTIWILSLLNGTSKVCSISGAIVALVADNITAKWIGVGLFALGETFDSATTIYEAKTTFDFEESGSLAKLNKEGVEHAQIFKKFLKQLKEIKQMEEQLLEEYQSHTKPPLLQHTIINLGSTKNLDECISACLNEYENLPSYYRREDVYCHMISHLIQMLPPTDPLRIGLKNLEPTLKDKNMINKDKNTINPLDQSLSMHYLPVVKTKKRSSEDEWINEQKANSTEETLQLEEKDLFSPQLDYTQKVACYKELVAQRFNLKYHVAFFDTAMGWRIDSKEGIKKISKSIEETSVSSSSSLSSSSSKKKVSLKKNESIV